MHAGAPPDQTPQFISLFLVLTGLFSSWAGMPADVSDICTETLYAAGAGCAHCKAASSLLQSSGSMHSLTRSAARIAGCDEQRRALPAAGSPLSYLDNNIDSFATLIHQVVYASL